jgi:NADPH-dependent 2,4-dienoyl-CoA reductase/sulfur reductase-like enzyme
VPANGESIEFTKPCLAMGGPVRPAMAGTSLGNVIYLRTVRDALALREMATLEKTIMVVGGGLLACESAASLRMMKMKVGLMHRDAYLLNRYIDPETGAWLTDYFTKHGVVLSMGEALNGSKANRPAQHSNQAVTVSRLVLPSLHAAQNRISILCAILH